MEKVKIASSNSVKDLERQLLALIGDPAIINGKILEVKGLKLQGYSVERKGNMIVCYQLAEREKIDELIQERNSLMVSGEDPKRLFELQAKINYIEYGIM